VSVTSTSRSLLARARARDPAVREGAWARLLELYAPLVLFWIRRAGLRDDDAADVLQEVFQTACARIDGFRRDRAGDSFRAWLRTLARTKVADAFRRRERQPTYVPGSELARRGPAPAADEAGSEDDARLERALGSDLLRRALAEVRAVVHARTFRAFELAVIEGRTPDSVGDELGMTPGAVRVAKSRVLQRLRAALGELE